MKLKLFVVVFQRLLSFLFSLFDPLIFYSDRAQFLHIS